MTWGGNALFDPGGRQDFDCHRGFSIGEGYGRVRVEGCVFSRVRILFPGTKNKVKKKFAFWLKCLNSFVSPNVARAKRQ